MLNSFTIHKFWPSRVSPPLFFLVVKSASAGSLDRGPPRPAGPQGPGRAGLAAASGEARRAEPRRGEAERSVPGWRVARALTAGGLTEAARAGPLRALRAEPPLLRTAPRPALHLTPRCPAPHRAPGSHVNNPTPNALPQPPPSTVQFARHRCERPRVTRGMVAAPTRRVPAPRAYLHSARHQRRICLVQGWEIRFCWRT